MKTLDEYLLSCLAEEAAEIIQATMKAERFGLDDIHPKRGNNTNRECISIEIDDLIAVADLLRERGVIRPPSPENVAAKKMKVSAWAEYSRDVGILELPVK